jgi:replicative DNA helicase
MNDAARKIETIPARTEKSPLFREAPSNIEAEQALLGAILVNNDAFYRVSDFLKPEHFQEPLHRKIYEVGGDIVRMGKTANPVTIKTFLHDHQRRRLWPDDLRACPAPVADQHRHRYRQ